jgi:molybdopterin molybdotransferase
LDPAQIALAAACGNPVLTVYCRPRVAILTTGDELVPADAAPGPGQIRNSNAPMLAALVSAAGADAIILPSASDSPDSLDAALAAASVADLLLISGGVSAGTHDLVEPALERRGARFHFTGVRIQPGKPLVFGEMRHTAASTGTATDAGPSRTLHFFGLPGNPISSAATFALFAAPLLAALAGEANPMPRFAAARLAAQIRVAPGLTRFLPARCDFAPPGAELPTVAPVPWHGSGDLASFAHANCFLVVPEDVPVLESGALVRILPL